jgi:predicted RNA-binding Zn ribbon-like protein
MSNGSDAFDWSGGHPALDLVNTLDERPFEHPIETLVTYIDLARFVAFAGMVEPATGQRLARLSGIRCTETLERTIELREHLHDALRAMLSGRPLPMRDLDAISTAVQAAHGSRKLIVTTSPGFAGHTWSDGLAPEIPLHACAIAVEHLLTQVDRTKVRKCAASDCDVWFLDASKAHHRQWCSMKGCGNREKQRRRRLPTQSTE